jgi:hypothetical protein
MSSPRLAEADTPKPTTRALVSAERRSGWQPRTGQYGGFPYGRLKRDPLEFRTVRPLVDQEMSHAQATDGLMTSTKTAKRSLSRARLAVAQFTIPPGDKEKHVSNLREVAGLPFRSPRRVPVRLSSGRTPSAAPATARLRSPAHDPSVKRSRR